MELTNLVENIAEILLKRNLTLSTAESCTGGNIAHQVTLVPGSSEYFKGGVVSYSNDVKLRVLGVSSESLEAHGAVSREVVTEMLAGAVRVLDTDCAVATSGVAGPGGGTPEKPVGTVWIGARVGEKDVIRLFRFGTDRSLNIESATEAALRLLLELLIAG
jgi:PncC family amidohydrolase